MMFALVDCNNFYASCERVFRPDLDGIPLVVLSNNDGCIIARSLEAKALGYQMGAPYFKTRGQLQSDKVQVFSSNYTLYGDLSARVMKSLEQHTPLVEPYSIDEAFMDLTGFDHLDRTAHIIKKQTQQWTGIPVSIGIAQTKTLAKLANAIAKKIPALKGVFVMERPDPACLATINIQDVWGIGRRLVPQLNAMGVQTALDLARLDPRLIRQKFNVMVERTTRELQGISCISFDAMPPHPRNIMVSRGFKGRIQDKQSLREAISLYTSLAAKKARARKVAATSITIFLKTSPFAAGPNYSNSRTLSYMEAVNDTLTLVKTADQILEDLFKPGLEYQKAGVILTGLVYQTEHQKSLFDNHVKADTAKREKLMATMDALNVRYGSETIKMASSGTNRSWWMAREHLSPCYTTRWADLKIVNNKSR